ncbi:MAG: hypothetical protein AAGE37_02960 [Pseudomonadota bacterium]
MKNAVSKCIWTMNAALGGAIMLAIASALLVPSPVQAQTQNLSDSQKAQIEQRLEQAGQRLQLTSAQKEQVIPILKSNMRANINILQRYGFSQDNRPKLSLRKKLSLRSDLSKQRDATNAKLSRILSGTQMKTLEKIQDENRARMRKRIQG